jgi:hypothetical protein
MGCPSVVGAPPSPTQTGACMTFCTTCAAPIPTHGTHCPQCDAPVGVLHMPLPQPEPPSTTRAISRALRLAPLLCSSLLLARWSNVSFPSVPGSIPPTQPLPPRKVRETWLGRAPPSLPSLAIGTLLSAQIGLSVLLAPQEESYAAGREAMQRGDYLAAVSLLEPVAEAVPPR